ncbi:MAG: hypothetical protein CVU64_08095 [Deltaproteobacteria bacterium HGW-Deltaproteobacteria-21]|nr:MAG: hypothetical protein CVU64_08095 [Deltaproteobacteria bacterium HGW-Deltaproteobacteria-21]
MEPYDLWSSLPQTSTAEKNLDAILSSVTGLPLPYWRERMFFRGLPDDLSYEWSGGRFPAKLNSGTHPVFSFKPLPDGIGFRVCPCSSKKPFDEKSYRFIQKGCPLLHTGYTMDRHSYLIEKIQLNIPRSLAPRLRFLGQVPEECIRHEQRV